MPSRLRGGSSSDTNANSLPFAHTWAIILSLQDCNEDTVTESSLDLIERAKAGDAGERKVYAAAALAGALVGAGAFGSLYSPLERLLRLPRIESATTSR